MDTITYLYLGKRDYRDALILFEAGSYTMACRLFQQAAEKYLKHYIQLHGSSEDMAVLSSHNTTKLYDRVVELGGLTMDREDRKMMSVLKDYYYDVNYPGENCREVDQTEAEEAKDFTDSFLLKLLSSR